MYIQILNCHVCHRCQQLQFSCYEGIKVTLKIATVCQISFHNVPDGGHDIFLIHCQDLMKEMEWLDKTEKREVINCFDELLRNGG